MVKKIIDLILTFGNYFRAFSYSAKYLNSSDKYSVTLHCYNSRIIYPLSRQHERFTSYKRDTFHTEKFISIFQLSPHFPSDTVPFSDKNQNLSTKNPFLQ